ncbi:MAG TPA: type II toxin-antitoxin system HicB family antitoxin [Gemmataceae bacterium]|jgi:predicted RNase H-like HicB family nuclease|nr:type II toxin-antitoxin system HicB family antitoxin [Gemmataceae bacterium]
MKTISKKKSKDAKTLKYAVILRKTATGYSADAPDVLGCIAAAKTLNGTRRLIAEALMYHFELMQETGETIPRPRGVVEFAADELDEESFCTWVDVKMPASRP